MIHVTGVVRLVDDPQITMTQSGTKVARYRAAAQRRAGGETVSDFVNFVAFGNGAEFAENNLFKGSRVFVSGHIQTGQYTNKDGQRINTTDIVVENHEFVDKKAETDALRAARAAQAPAQQAQASDDFVKVPEGSTEAFGLPFD